MRSKDKQPAAPDKPVGTPTPAARKRRVVRVVISSICAGIMLLLSGCLTAAAFWINSLLGTFQTPDPVDPTDDAVIAETKPVKTVVKMKASDYEAETVDEISLKGNSSTVTNYLVLGVNPNDHLADTNILISINTETRTIQVISLMRDVLVDIPRDNGTTVEWKLNAAHSWGRIKGHKATIEKNFRLEIDRYITLDFGVFSYAIEQLGGVDVELTAREAKYFLGYDEAGVYTLNGEKALAYSRERHIPTLDGNNDDWGRTERQRRVIAAAFAKATQNPLALSTKLIGILEQANINTTMQKDTLVELALQGLLEYKDYTIENHVIADHGTYVGKSGAYGSALALKDPVRSVLTLHEWIYGTETQE